MSDARAGLAVQLEAFAANTMEYLRRERELLLDGVGVPDITTELEGRHALVVVRGYHYKQDLQTLRHYIREFRPVLIGVDGGADALMEEGHRPDLIVGDMDSVSDATLTSGAEVVVHAYRDGNAPGLDRVRKLGIDPVVFPATGTSEDVAMLLADDKGATIIVAVGTHATLVEFLDKGRSGMASTFLTRLRVGGKLVDAKGVSQLYRSRISNLSLAVMLLVGLFALFVALAATPGGTAMLAAGRCPVGRRVVPDRRTVSRDRLPLPPRLHRLDLPGARGRDRARCRSAQGGPGQHADPGAHAAAAGQDRPARRPHHRTEEHRARDTWAEAVAPAVVSGTLTGKTVAVVVAPGADGGAVKNTVATLTAAGARVGSTITLSDAWVDPGKRTFRNNLANQLAALVKVPGGASSPDSAAWRGAVAGDPQRHRPSRRAAWSRGPARRSTVCARPNCWTSAPTRSRRRRAS